MSFKQILASAVPVFLTLYLGVYLSCLVPSFIGNETIDYNWVGLFLLILAGSTSVIFMTDIWSNRILYYLILFANISLIAISFMLENTALFLVTALFQGLLCGIIFKPSLFRQQLSHDLFAWTSFGIAFVGICVMVNDVVPGNILAYAIMGLSLLFMALYRPIVKDEILEEEKIGIPSKFQDWSILIMAGIIITIELSFICWSLILKDDSQNVFHQLSFYIAFVLVFVFRKYGHSLCDKCLDIGWIFSLSIVLTLSLGLFYTFSIPILFIMGFAFSLAYLQVLILSYYRFKLKMLHISTILMLVAILNLIFGLFVQNHVEYIVSIKIPENVLALSARQAVIKELTSGGAILVIISGLLFLFRRKWQSVKL